MNLCVTLMAVASADGALALPASHATKPDATETRAVTTTSPAKASSHETGKVGAAKTSGAGKKDLNKLYNDPNQFIPIRSAFFKVDKRPDDATNLPITDEKHFFGDVVFKKAPAVVFCVDEWSTPCKMMSTIMDSIAKEPKYKGVNFYYMRCYKRTDFFSEYNLHIFPTILFLKDGKLFSKQEGFATKTSVEKHIDSVL